MNHIKYLIAKIRLFFAHLLTNSAKDHMNSVIRSSRAAQDEIDDSYENFINRCKEQEKAAVAVKRLRGDSDNPILDIDLGIKHFTIKPSLSSRLTRLDAEVAVTRHRFGDWGEVTLQNWRSNNSEASNPYGLLRSRYPLFGGGYFIVETDKRVNRTELYLDGGL